MQNIQCSRGSWEKGALDTGLRALEGDWRLRPWKTVLFSGKRRSTWARASLSTFQHFSLPNSRSSKALGLRVCATWHFVSTSLSRLVCLNVHLSHDILSHFVHPIFFCVKRALSCEAMKWFVKIIVSRMRHRSQIEVMVSRTEAV